MRAARAFVGPLLTVLAATAGVAVSGSLEAQDRFGQAVAVAGDEVLVLKPEAGRGPATVYVYLPGADGWRVVERLRPADASETGHGTSASMTLDRGRLWIGSGDPGVRWAAHVFRRDGGGWMAGRRVAVDPGRPAAPDPSTLDLAGLMRIMQPPSRVVALQGGRALTAVVEGPGAGVRVLEEEGDGDAWSVAAVVEAPGVRPQDRFGQTLALRGDRAFVGAPLHGGSGAVFVFERSAATGVWLLEETLKSDDGPSEPARSRENEVEGPPSPPAAGFGVAVAIDGDRLLVGAPGSAAVHVYRHDARGGSWTETGRLTSEDASSGVAGDRFGAAVAVRGDELWVGAPAGFGGRGVVHRFRRGGPDRSWEPDPAGPVRGPAPGSAFGASVAVGDEVAVAGAPDSDAGFGRAAAFTREPNGEWSQPAWLRPAEDLTAVVGGEVLCTDGEAAGFQCENVDLLAFLPIDAIGGDPGERVSDLWGWTDPQTGREYALVGRTGGAALVDVTDPARPSYRGVVKAEPSGARDLKVYRDHLFFTGDGAGDHGLVVFDLTRLRDAPAPAEFEPDTVYRGIASAHNLALDTDAGFAYPVGASGGGETCGGGLHMVDVRDPLRPTFAGCYTDTEGLIWQGRTHDAQCVVYGGPDEAYRGRQICFASNETALRIVDVTDKEDPVPLAAARYPRLSYVHQGWLTEDQRYFYMDDELDELMGQAERTRTLVWDIAELDDPVFFGEFYGSTPASDHNLFIRGNRMYQANYHAGMQVWDVSDPESPVEIGHFDTTPWEGDPPGFFGAWSAYPFFESGTVAVTSIGEGLFLLRPREVFP